MSTAESQANKLASFILPESQQITPELVYELSDALEAVGIEPTVARIRMLNRDRGSASSIAPALKEWKLQRDRDQHLADSIDTDDLLAATAPLIRRIAALVAAEHQRELDQHSRDEAILIDQLELKDESRVALELQLKETQDKLNEAHETISAQEAHADNLMRKVSKTKAEMELLQAENRRLENAAITGAEHQKTLTAKLEESKQDLQASQAELRSISYENRDLQTALAELRVKADLQSGTIEDLNLKIEGLQKEMTLERASWLEALKNLNK